MPRNPSILISLLFTSIFFLACQPVKKESVNLIPKPESIEISSGRFIVDSELVLNSELSDETILGLELRISEILGVKLQKGNDKSSRPNAKRVTIKRASDILQDEGYKLAISSTEMLIEASEISGFKNAINTLDQIAKISQVDRSETSLENLSLPALSISDSPNFAWRGLMLDCSRTFIPISEIKKFIDALALYKMNVLHLHLTDDQGWRLEIKKYPELTDLCSETNSKYTNDKGGYYSQEEMKDLIEYADIRNVTIVPEIELPGHSSEIFAAFPELSCTGNQTEIFPFFSGPGITEDILCAGKEEVFTFLENVLDEVCELFPSEYIHIGGDEAPKVRWDNCEDCQKRIEDENLKDSHELQSYFIQRIEALLKSRGKKLIGWDEILEGGLAENAAVMSWRGTKGGIDAASAGHPVVMSPTSHCYFDYSYGTTPVEQVYGFNPIPEELNASQSEFILGAQANFWSHIDRQSYAMERQIFPRIIALAENLWSSDISDFVDFESRLESHYPILDSLKINYYHPSKIIQPNDSTDFAAKLNLEGYEFDFHGFNGAEFNYQGMACKVVLPDTLAEGHPWVWRARFWGHEPQLDIALLEKGYHVVYCEVGALFGNEVAVDRWNRFYTLMQRGGLAKEGILEGMSRGGLIIYNWALANPDKVSGIYADAPVLDGSSWPGGFGTGKGSRGDWEKFKNAYEIKTKSDSIAFRGNPIHNAAEIGKLGIPMIHVCGAADKVVPISENTDLFEKIVLKNGGKVMVIRKPGVGHHPHSLKDPQAILDFLF